MARWLLPTGLRALRMLWPRMPWRLVMLLVVRRSRRMRLTLVRLLLGCLLVMRRRASRLLTRVLLLRLAMLLLRPVLVMLRCRRRILPRVVPRRLLWMLVVRRLRRLVWIRWFPTLPEFSPGRLLMMWRLLSRHARARRRRGIRP